jgi:hypothetical protein
MADDRYPKVIPPPQHVAFAGVRRDFDKIVLHTDSDTDAWALGVLETGLSALSIPLADGGMSVRVTTDSGVLAGIIDRCASEFGTDCTADRLGDEGYVIAWESGDAVIAASTGAGLAYGVDSFLQLIEEGAIHEALVFDYPAFKYRIYGGAGDMDHAAKLRFNMGRKGGTAEELAEMRLRHMEPWLSVHPSHAAGGMPGLCYSDPDAVTDAITPLIEAAERGVKWLALSFDDIDLKLGHKDDLLKYGNIGNAHVSFLNETAERLRGINPDARLIVIPIIYANNWLPGTWVYAVDETEVYDYLETLGREVDPSVAFVWTGESVESVAMTDDDIRQWKELIPHETIVFENTPAGDPDDLGAFKLRTLNAGDLLEGWIYIHRGPHAELAEWSTAEFLWNPKAYEPTEAQQRAIMNAVGPEAAPAIARLVSVFTQDGGPRYANPLWREGRLLEVVDPDDQSVAEFQLKRMEATSKAVQALDGLGLDTPFYNAIRKRALDASQVSRAFLDTYVMTRAIQEGEHAEAVAAGDRAEALHQEWRRFSTGTTDLNADTDRRDAMLYIEEVDVAGSLRALRRGYADRGVRSGGGPAWVYPESTGTRLGRECATGAVTLKVASGGASDWLVVTGCGAADAPITFEVDGAAIEMPVDAWQPDRWRSVAVKLPDGPAERLITVSASETDWALYRVAVLPGPSPEQLLHAVRSATTPGEGSRLRNPDRYLRGASYGPVEGNVAIRTSVDLVRSASGSFFDLADGTRLGQTFCVPTVTPVSPKDPVHLYARESADADHLHGIGLMFTRVGHTPLELQLRRWNGGVEETLGDSDLLIASVVGVPGTPYGSSRHWVFFPFDVELDRSATYYFEITAPESWQGWRTRRTYGWYGQRSDPTRSVYIDGCMEPGVDLAFRTYVADVYDADWKD